MKHIEDTWPEKLKDEVRSLRINIGMDGVNPYSLQQFEFQRQPSESRPSALKPYFTWSQVYHPKDSLQQLEFQRQPRKSIFVYLDSKWTQSLYFKELLVAALEDK